MVIDAKRMTLLGVAGVKPGHCRGRPAPASEFAEQVLPEGEIADLSGRREDRTPRLSGA